MFKINQITICFKVRKITRKSQNIHRLKMLKMRKQTHKLENEYYKNNFTNIINAFMQRKHIFSYLTS